jgi:hypothetical protein
MSHHELRPGNIWPTWWMLGALPECCQCFHVLTILCHKNGALSVMRVYGAFYINTCILIAKPVRHSFSQNFSWINQHIKTEWSTVKLENVRMLLTRQIQTILWTVSQVDPSLGQLGRLCQVTVVSPHKLTSMMSALMMLVSLVPQIRQFFSL